MDKDNARRRGESPAEEHQWITPEEIAAGAPHFGSREELTDALEGKGWAVFVSADGDAVAGAPKGNPTDDGCPCCSGVEAVRLEGKGLITGGCAIFAGSAMWGDGPAKERLFALIHQGAERGLDDVRVVVNEIPTPEQAEAFVREAAAMEGAS